MKKLILLLLFLKSISSCSAQEDSLQKRNDWKLFASAGFGTGVKNHELNSAVKFFVLNGSNTVISRFQLCFDTGIGSASVDIKLHEYAILYAYNSSAYSDSGQVYFSFGAGLGYVQGIARGRFIENHHGGLFQTPFDNYEKYEELKVANPGLALDIHIIKPGGDHLGVGASIFANINSVYPIFGCSFLLYFGNP